MRNMNNPALAINFARPWQRMEKQQLAAMVLFIVIFSPIILILIDITLTTDLTFGLVFTSVIVIIMVIPVFFFWCAYKQSRDRLIKVVMFRPDVLIGTIDNALRYHRIGFVRESFYRDFTWNPLKTMEIFNVTPYDIRITIIRANNRISWVSLDPITDGNQHYIEYMKQIIDNALDTGALRKWNRLDRIQMGAMGVFILMTFVFAFAEKESTGTYTSPMVILLIFILLITLFSIFQIRGNRVKTFSKDPIMSIQLIETMLMQRYPRFRKTICGGSPREFPIRYIEIFSDDVQGLYIKFRKQYVNVTVIDVGRETRANKEVIREITESIDAALNVTMMPPVPQINYGGLGGYQQHVHHAHSNEQNPEERMRRP